MGFTLSELVEMSLLLGIDLGTTKTTCIAVDPESGQIVASEAKPTDGNITSDEGRRLGRSEWDAEAVLRSGFDCLTEIVNASAVVGRPVGSVGVTGQQHGMVLVDSDLKPLSPLINWQDQRGNEPMPGCAVSWVEEARNRCGQNSLSRLGCRLNSGFLGTTLFWLNQQGLVPENSRACFIMDLFVAMLTDGELRTDPSVAASGGIMNVASRDWDDDVLAALEIRRNQLPVVQEADCAAGGLSGSRFNGLASGTPISVPIGDHQASFLGSVADRRSSVLLNIGTGAQVAMFTEGTNFSPPVELRPFPIQGNLLSNVGLAGGWSFQVIENFVRQLGIDVFGVDVEQPLYSRLAELAGQADPDSQGLKCVPTFSGTRSDPLQAGSLAGMTPGNLTPANFARSVLEGMAENYRNALDQIFSITGQPASSPTLVGAGNGLRENSVLADAVARRFGAAAVVTRHREEAAFGAALVGGVAEGVFSSLDEAGRLVQHQAL
jgi:sugar (pentulose or hexulose) kinase